MLITAEDSRTTVELEDRFVIRPAFKFWTTDEEEDGDATEDGRPVEDDFTYSSDRNRDWLDGARLETMLGELGRTP